MAKAKTPVRVLGIEIMDFYDHGWPDGWYHDDNALEFHDQEAPLDVNGHAIWLLKPDQKYDLAECGILQSEDPEVRERMTFEEAFLKWKRVSKYITVGVSIPKEMLDQTIAELKAKGCKVKQ